MVDLVGDSDSSVELCCCPEVTPTPRLNYVLAPSGFAECKRSAAAMRK